MKIQLILLNTSVSWWLFSEWLRTLWTNFRESDAILSISFILSGYRALLGCTLGQPPSLLPWIWTLSLPLVLELRSGKPIIFPLSCICFRFVSVISESGREATLTVLAGRKEGGHLYTFICPLLKCREWRRVF